LAALYCSQGYVLIIPDLLGFRDDPSPHPYVLYPQISVRGAVKTLNDMVGFFKGKGLSNMPLYSIGYS
jgi:hypothetical protein